MVSRVGVRQVGVDMVSIDREPMLRDDVLMFCAKAGLSARSMARSTVEIAIWVTADPSFCFAICIAKPRYT